MCECVCGGKNHGVGRAKALENAAHDFKDVIERANDLIDPGGQMILI